MSRHAQVDVYVPATSVCRLVVAVLFAATFSVTGCDSSGGEASAPASSPPPKAGFVPVDPGRSCPSPAPEWHCLTPFPSDFHRAQNANPTGDGPMLVLPKLGVPTTTDGERLDLITPGNFDGASVLPQIVVTIPGGVDGAPLIFHDEDLARSREVANSPTLLLDTTTGEAVGHFAEIDPRPDHVDHRALIIRPMRPLAWGRRYVVVVQRLKRLDGTPVPRSPTFDRIFRDAGDNDIEQQQGKYYAAHILPTLSAAGVVSADVVLAWDFTTATGDNVRGRVSAMAKDARDQVAAGLFGEVTVTSQSAGTNPETAWWITGVIKLPAYIDNVLHPSYHATTVAKGSFTVPFRVLVSAAAAKTLQAGGTPPVVIMGHGFFGEAAELASGGYRRAAQAAGAVAIGIDWWGLSKSDAAPIVGGLVAKLAPLAALVDRLEQGLVNVVALAALTRRTPQKTGVEGAQPPFGLTSLTLPGTQLPLLHPTARLGYYGCSLGHILGAAAVALSPDIERAALQVGGAGFGLIMSRSLPFGGLQGILGGRFANQGETLLAVLQLADLLAPVDPVSWCEELSTSADGGVRPLLLHAGLSDASVPLMAAEVHARGLGLPLLTPAPRSVWGLTEAPVGNATRGLVEVDFGVPNPAVLALPPGKENAVHNGVRNVAPVIAQIGAFLRGDPIPAACSGACDPD